MNPIKSGWFRKRLLPVMLRCQDSGIDITSKTAVDDWASLYADPKISKVIAEHYDDLSKAVIYWTKHVQAVKDLFEVNSSYDIPELDTMLSKVRGQYVDTDVMRLCLAQESIETPNLNIKQEVGGQYLCPKCGLPLRRGMGFCPYCKGNPQEIINDDDQDAKVKEAVKKFIQYLALKMVTGKSWEYEDEDEKLEDLPTISEEKFESIVEKAFKDKPIPIGKNKDGEQLLLDFDYATVIFDEKNHRWRVAAVSFGIMDEDGGYPKMILFKAPKLDVYKSKRFGADMVNWMTKKWDLTEFNDLAVSKEIMKIVKQAETYQ